MNEFQPITWAAPRVLPDNSHYTVVPADFDAARQVSIETGYFVFTLMPSLRCQLNCPHCYLTLEQRRHSPIMSVEQLEVACRKVEAYYAARPHIKTRMIVCYWYGGEPTDMGQAYLLDAFEMMARVFTPEKGYYVRHEILTSLINVDASWFRIFHSWGRGHFQTSFDGLMRGKGYMKKWDRRVREAVADGLSVSTISVVNHALVNDGPEAVLDYLIDLGVSEASFLPFMLNEQNQGEKYETFAPPMAVYSTFMIALTEHWYRRRAEGARVPYIGQQMFILEQSRLPPAANIAGQTLFLLPDGDMVLPDYRDGYLEFMRPFGNILSQDFSAILEGEARQAFLRRQITRNRNDDCLRCPHADKCLMEFWKPNREGDECFGARRYVEWVLEEEKRQGALKSERALMF